MKASLLKIYLSEDDMYEGKSAHHAVIEFLMRSGIAGATVEHCIEGYGTHNQIHTANILRMSTSLPMIIQAIDKEEKLRNIIPMLREMLPTELITIQDIEVISGGDFGDEL